MIFDHIRGGDKMSNNNEEVVMKNGSLTFLGAMHNFKCIMHAPFLCNLVQFMHRKVECSFMISKAIC